jgi:hypothetical protein
MKRKTNLFIKLAIIFVFCIGIFSSFKWTNTYAFSFGTSSSYSSSNYTNENEGSSSTSVGFLSSNRSNSNFSTSNKYSSSYNNESENFSGRSNSNFSTSNKYSSSGPSGNSNNYNESNYSNNSSSNSNNNNNSSSGFNIFGNIRRHHSNMPMFNFGMPGYRSHRHFAFLGGSHFFKIISVLAVNIIFLLSLVITNM